MRKTQIFAAAVMLAFGLASCVTGGDTTVKKGPTEGSVGYMSVKVKFQEKTRASGENDGLEAESKVNSLYLVTFNDQNAIVANPDGGFLFVYETFAAPEIIKVGGGATKILAVANPGTKLLAVLNSLNGGSNFALFNEAIASITITDIVDATKGFAMISCPTDEDVDPGDKITSALVDIDVAVVGNGAGEFETEEEAIEEAEENPISISLERIASKIILTNTVPTTILPAGASFSFTSWTVDALNTTYFPFAEKTILSTIHTAVGGTYVSNFYTKDPTYLDTPGLQSYHPGLAYVTVPRTGANAFTPVLPWDKYYDWKTATNDAGRLAYLVENTMDASAQRYGNATRVVIKGLYAPVGFTLGQDWFRFAGKDYKTLTELQAAYALAESTGPLATACDKFYTSVKAAGGSAVTATNFAGLNAAQIAGIDNGGEVVKDEDRAVIRWYKGSLNYWYYEIRHDNAINGYMEYAKYGVVRNNWYNLSLNTIKDAGTPWYPDLVHPGEDDPKPWDPIDDKYGYIAIDIEAAPWIVWEHNMTI